MLKKKMPFGIVMIFLFASPILDPTILTIMAVILGWKVALIYTLVTAIFSVIIGFTLEALGLQKEVKEVIMTGYEEQSKKFSFKSAWRETVTLMKSVFPYLILGAAIGSIIHGVIPTEWISNFFGEDRWWLIPVAAIVGIPLYIRLSSMIHVHPISDSKATMSGFIFYLV
jgi:uncharacterized membrane protein YraQ (UPF0718 family)